MFGIDDALIGGVLGIGGALLNNKGAKDNQTGQTLSPWQSLPKEVQDAYLKTYLPDAQKAYATPFPAAPTMRASDPSKDPFASQGLWQLQQIRDAQLANESRGGGAKPAAAAPAAPTGPSPEELYGRTMMNQGQADKGGLGMVPTYSNVMPGGKKIPVYASPQTPDDYAALGRIGMYLQDNPINATRDWRTDPNLIEKFKANALSPLMGQSLGLSQYFPNGGR